MHKFFPFLLTIVVCISLTTACTNSDAPSQNTASAEDAASALAKAEEGIRAANDQLYAGLNAMFTGDLKPLEALWAHSESITDMGPFGGRLTGWTAVYEEFKKETEMKFGGKIFCKDLHVYAGTDMGYTLCIETGENMTADGKPIVVNHRATNIFQLQDGQWKLIHHHTDLAGQLKESFDVNTD